MYTFGSLFNVNTSEWHGQGGRVREGGVPPPTLERFLNIHDGHHAISCILLGEFLMLFREKGASKGLGRVYIGDFLSFMLIGQRAISCIVFVGDL